jgi:AraC-like DNA-binding protein
LQAIIHVCLSGKFVHLSDLNPPARKRAAVAHAMDVLTAVLDSLRLKSTLYCQSTLIAPWALRYVPCATAVFHVLERGSACLIADGANAMSLGAGDLIVLPQGIGHTIGDSPRTRPRRDIHLERELPDTPIRKIQRGQGAQSVLICGLFNTEVPSRSLFAGLPAVMHFPAQQTHALGIAPVLDLLAREMNAPDAGSEIMGRRLTDTLLVQVMRACLRDEKQSRAGWLAALRDPHVGHALALMHTQLDHDWSVEELAARVSLSRSTLNARFADWIGLGPAEYLTRWRMQRAADLLARTTHGCAKIAAQVGYADEAAFGKAFKREMGQTPGQYRAAARRARS